MGCGEHFAVTKVGDWQFLLLLCDGNIVAVVDIPRLALSVFSCAMSILLWGVGVGVDIRLVGWVCENTGVRGDIPVASDASPGVIRMSFGNSNSHRRIPK
jgi:hypothetical protein